LAELYERHAPALSRRLLRLLGRPDEVGDVMQVTFLELHRALARYQPDRSFGAWLHGFAFFVAARHLKARRRRWWLRHADEGQIDAAPDSTTSPEEQADQRALVRAVYAVLDTLPAKKRVAFTMHVFEGMSLTEIGEITGDSPQTIRARVESARAKIHKSLRSGVKS
jgi:RNA polymerase sigma-70 factor (ECF subfamily)